MSTETNYEPLLPSDATKLLAERRWNQESQPSKEETPSPPLLNEEQLYGKAGVEQAAGYTEMASAFPVKAPIEGEVSEKEASAELLKDREPPPGERPVDAEIQYLNIDTGKPKAPNETVSAEQAAADLSRYRQGIAETQRALEDVELHRVIDSLRAGDAAQQSPPVEAQPPHSKLRSRLRLANRRHRPTTNKKPSVALWNSILSC